ncbi:hypothetical protein SDJN02_13746, partial [Cucurbita argyrosperma subsp. argyrosperma]
MCDASAALKRVPDWSQIIDRIATFHIQFRLSLLSIKSYEYPLSKASTISEKWMGRVFIHFSDMSKLDMKFETPCLDEKALSKRDYVRTVIDFD